MSAFDGTRNDVDWVAVTRDPDWVGTFNVSRDHRTIGFRLDLTNTSWSTDDVIVAPGGLPNEFRPTGGTRYHPAMNRSTGGTIWLRVLATGEVQAVQAGTVGLLGSFTYLR